MGATDYCTLTELKSYLAISGTGEDGLLADLITAASRLIDEACGRTFSAREETRTYDAAGEHIAGRLLFLDDDLLSVTTLINGDGTTIAAADYLLRPLNFSPAFGISLRQASGLSWACTSSPEGAISVTGSWGYSATVPEAIKLAAIKLAGWLYQSRNSGGLEARTITFDARGNAILLRLLPRDVTDLLRPYIRLRIRG